MNPDLTQLFREAADEPLEGPDLARVENEVRRRQHRRRSLSLVVVAALTLVSLAVLQSDLDVPLPVAEPMSDLEVALLDSGPTEADSALEEAANRGVALDGGSVRLWGVVEGFRYGVATAESGTQICILKMGKGSNSTIGLVSCGETTRFTRDGVFAMATNSVPDHVESHAHVAVVVPDGYSEVIYEGATLEIEKNMIVITSPPYPTAITLEGPRGRRTVMLPSMPSPGDAPRTS